MPPTLLAGGFVRIPEALGSLAGGLALGGPEGQNGLDSLIQVVQLSQQFVVPLLQFRQEL